jgi:Ala-tRNA(Pro) deacylase
MATSKDLVKYLNDNHVEHTVLTHPAAFTPSELALYTLTEERCIAQTVLVQAEEHFWMVVFPGDRRIDQKVLAALLETKRLRMADESDMLFFFPECKVDPMPPFGNLFGFPVIADKSLKSGKRILFGACSPTESVFMRWEDYERLARPIVADFTELLPQHRVFEHSQSII